MESSRILSGQSSCVRFLTAALLPTVVLVLLAGPGVAVAQQPQKAPLNPAFVDWQERALKGAQFEHGYVPPPFDWSHIEQLPIKDGGGVGLPQSYDMRTQGELTPVKNQSTCGCCWTFASYASLESWLVKHVAQTWDFSENHLKNYHGFLWGPCSGGNTDMTTAYLTRGEGPVDEADDPYHPYDDRPSPGGPAQKYVRNVRRYVDPADIKSAIMNTGALTTAMYWDDAYFNTGDNTYYYGGSADTDHLVALVGWDDNIAVAGAPGDGAWIVKNSWSTSWGDAGYFYLSYYDTASVAQAVAFSDAVVPHEYSTIYQYDDLGMTSGFGYGETSWGANLFTATADEDLVAVGLHATSSNMNYEVYVYDDFNSGTGTFSNLLTSTSGTAPFAGYYTVDLPSPVPLTNGDDFGIAVRFNTPGYPYPVPIETPVGGYAAPTADPGESYASQFGSSFTDVTSIYADTNVAIKGLTAGGLRFITQPSGGFFEEGQSHILEIEVTDTVGTVTYQWYQNGVAVTGATGTQLVLDPLTVDDSGSYWCRVTDDGGQHDSSQAYVVVGVEGSLPVIGVTGIAVMVAGCGLAAIGVLSRRKNK